MSSNLDMGRRHGWLAAVLLFCLAGCGQPEASPKKEKEEETPTEIWLCDRKAVPQPIEERKDCEAKEGWRWAFVPEEWKCFPPKPETPATGSECEALGGAPNPFPEGPDVPYVSCSLPTSDAGAPCCGNEGCEGFCLARSGLEVGAKTDGGCAKETMPLAWAQVKDGIYIGGISFDPGE